MAQPRPGGPGEARMASPWTGVTSQMLRNARRMTVRGFAEHLGISDRMISKWEKGGAAMIPRPLNQAALDTSMSLCTAAEKQRFWTLFRAADSCPACGAPTRRPGAES